MIQGVSWHLCWAGSSRQQKAVRECEPELQATLKQSVLATTSNPHKAGRLLKPQQGKLEDEVRLEVPGDSPQGPARRLQVPVSNRSHCKSEQTGWLQVPEASSRGYPTAKAPLCSSWNTFFVTHHQGLRAHAGTSPSEVTLSIKTTALLPSHTVCFGNMDFSTTLLRPEKAKRAEIWGSHSSN